MQLPTKEKIKKCPHGISSYYYQVNDDWGIKFFHKRDERDYSKTFQKSNYLAGLAPSVGNNVNHQGYYGYFTEHVDMINKIYKHFDNIPNKILKQIDTLSEDIKMSSDFDIDKNWHNFGINKNGKLICVDFGYFAENRYEYFAR